MAVFQLLAPLALLLQQSPALPTGTPVEKVECRQSPEKSYALYLPSTYRSDRSWPVLFCFDPRRRGMVPLELFRSTAEELGYIIISSNDYFSDGDINPAWEGVLAAWNDATRRFPIDPHRIYLTGLSGGARVSWVLADYSPLPIAGIIGVGAGLPWREMRESLDMSRLSFLGVAGEVDFNHQEMVELDRRLDQTPIPNHFVDFPGPHTWPSAEDAGWALRWMHAEALAKGLIPTDPAFRASFFEKRLARTEIRRAAGDWIGAEAALADLNRQIPDLSAEKGVPKALEEIRNSKQLARHIQDRERGLKNYRDDMQTVSVALQPFRVGDARRPGFKQLQRDLNLFRLRKLAEETDERKRERSLAARRVLQSVLTDTSFYIARDLKAQGDYKALTTVLRVAVELAPDQAVYWWRLSGAWALFGRKEDALHALETAVKKGFRRLDIIRRDPDLEAIRNHPRFSKIVGQGEP